MVLASGILSAIPTAAKISACRGPAPNGAMIAEPVELVWNQETIRAFGSAFRRRQGAILGAAGVDGRDGAFLTPLVCFFVLFAITVWVYFRAPKWWEVRSITTHYVMITLYPFLTGVVELFRFNFDGSRLGFSSALWHNIPEYYMLSVLYIGQDRTTRNIRWWLMFWWAFQIMCLNLPSLDGVQRGLFGAGVLEQAFGIACDYNLLFLQFYLWATTRPESPTKKVWMYAFLGAVFHLLEIVPLVGILIGLLPRTSLAVTAFIGFFEPICFVIYSEFGLLFNYGSDSVNDMAKEDAAHIKGSTKVTIFILATLTGLFSIFGMTAIIPECQGKALERMTSLPSSMNMECSAPGYPGHLGPSQQPPIEILKTVPNLPGYCLDSRVYIFGTAFSENLKSQYLQTAFASALPSFVGESSASQLSSIETYSLDFTGAALTWIEEWANLEAFYERKLGMLDYLQDSSMISTSTVSKPFHRIVRCNRRVRTASPTCMKITRKSIPQTSGWCFGSAIYGLQQWTIKSGKTVEFLDALLDVVDFVEGLPGNLMFMPLKTDLSFAEVNNNEPELVYIAEKWVDHASVVSYERAVSEKVSSLTKFIDENNPPVLWGPQSQAGGLAYPRFIPFPYDNNNIHYYHPILPCKSGASSTEFAKELFELYSE